MLGTYRAVRYACFAVVATLINLATQWTWFHLYSGIAQLYLGIMAGTATGLLSKYLLDKFWIFNDRSFELTTNLQKFFWYTLTGGLTTAIFWGFETTFALASNNQNMRYVGAIIGLTIGYFLKFHLDNRFVFRSRT